MAGATSAAQPSQPACHPSRGGPYLASKGSRDRKFWSCQLVGTPLESHFKFSMGSVMLPLGLSSACFSSAHCTSAPFQVTDPECIPKTHPAENDIFAASPPTSASWVAQPEKHIVGIITLLTHKNTVPYRWAFTGY